VRIADAQIHIWAGDSPDRPWPAWAASLAHRPQPLGDREILEHLDGAGVARAILVPPTWEGDRNDVAIAAAAAHPERFAVMGRIDLQQPMTEDGLRAWMSPQGMLGARITFGRGPQREWLHDGTADWLWPLAESAGLRMMVFAPGQLGDLARIVRHHPGMSVIVDHCGLEFGQQDDTILGSIDALLDLADLPNLAIKASALPCYVREAYPFPVLQRCVARLVEGFGPSRVMWGSDLSRLPCPYGQWISALTDACDLMSESDKDLVMGAALQEWLGWP
jgi:predicted TIM-barrel fold metal-dependent hydrolase